jgi:excisionase family DNA binding protein
MIFMPPKIVLEQHLRPAGLPDDLINEIPAAWYQGPGEKNPYFPKPVVEQFVKERRPKSLDKKSFGEEEGFKVIATQQIGRSSGPLLKTREAAKYLAISERQLQYEVQRGRLAVIRMGRSTRFTTADLEDFVGRCRSEGGEG